MEHTNERTKPIKNLYPYQKADIETIFRRVSEKPLNYKLLYQLPTGGGKTVVFSEIVKRFTELHGQKALVLTHRNELCKQTSRTLKALGIANKTITSNVKSVAHDDSYSCYVAMVETLKNRIKDNEIHVDQIGLVIIDEAHHNSFGKLLGNFKNAFIIGVTATPLSAVAGLPMRKNYDELIVGETIPSLIDQGFLAKGETYGYEVELNSLKTGINGDFTVKSSDELYSTHAMLELLLQAYEARAKGKKTLIFNNGIHTSLSVRDTFEAAGYPIRHLDNKTPVSEREEILKWFKKTKDAILTSVSILTTGFDEPSVEAVILNRATKSLTLYYQMIGRGSRRLPKKKTFSIIDLGNNAERFGLWSDTIDWKHVFEKPDHYLENHNSSDESGSVYVMPHALRALFPNSGEVTFDVEAAFKKAAENDQKPKTVIKDSIRQHAFMCIANAESISEARKLAEALDPDIAFRVKHYTLCLDKPTKSYRDWLTEDYKQRLNILIGKIFGKFDLEGDKEFKKL